MKVNDATVAALAIGREFDGLSVAELAEKAGVSISQIQAIEG
ncbi:helix-turn-helix transcriptional regulator [Labrys sp. ZIDIC5]|nr:helix-turn-helix transcriptional regulator [Labrys sp. ZIDIC5]MDZ5454801.1 helix-turn-helix transcriptional regulator [Labrys sp. ZIDIC5]